MRGSRWIGLLGVAALVGGVAVSTVRAATEVSFSTSATVSGEITLDCTARELLPPDGAIGAIVTSFDFGLLEEVEFPNPLDPLNPFRELRGTKGFQVWCGVNAHQQSWSLTHTGSALTNGLSTIPDNAYVVSVIKNDPTQPVPAGTTFPFGVAVLDVVNGIDAQRDSAVGTHTLVQSNPAGDSFTAVITYGLPGSDPLGGLPDSFPDRVIPVDQALGPYSGDVTLTLTAI